MVTKSSRPRPLDHAALDQLALSYVARFATSAARCADYLKRKLRERGWSGEGDPGVDAIVARLVASGYIDDAAFAASKASSLLRRGYGPRRIAQSLQQAGIGEGERAAAQPNLSAARIAALALARKRGFGPFGAAWPDPARREKQIAAMLRAGHRLDSARQLVDAASQQAAEEWAWQDGD